VAGGTGSLRPDGFDTIAGLAELLPQPATCMSTVRVWMSGAPARQIRAAGRGSVTAFALDQGAQQLESVAVS